MRQQGVETQAQPPAQPGAQGRADANGDEGEYRKVVGVIRHGPGFYPARRPLDRRICPGWLPGIVTRTNSP